MASTRPRGQFAYRRGQADEAPAAFARDADLFAYRLVRSNGSDDGRAAYNAEIAPGDVILDYRGRWLRVLAHRPITDEGSPFDAILEIEPA